MDGEQNVRMPLTYSLLKSYFVEVFSLTQYLEVILRNFGEGESSTSPGEFFSEEDTEAYQNLLKGSFVCIHLDVAKPKFIRSDPFMQMSEVKYIFSTFLKLAIHDNFYSSSIALRRRYFKKTEGKLPIYLH